MMRTRAPRGYGQAVSEQHATTGTETGAERRTLLTIPLGIWDAAAALLLAFILIQSVNRSEQIRPLHASVNLGMAAACVIAIAVGLRRYAPLRMLAVCVLGTGALYLGGFQRDPSVAIGLVLYTVATDKPRRISLAALGTAIAVTLIVFGIAPAPVYAPAKVPPGGLAFIGQAMSPIAVLCTGWALGFAVRRQRLYLAAVRAQAEDQVRVQSGLAWRAVTEERLRIARELHDVVAHGMSVITVQAGVGRHVIDEQPEQARAALAAIEETGRESLREMRRLLGVLREGEGGGVLTPAPRLADLEELVQRTAQTGTAVEFAVRGKPRVLPGGVELSAYRIVQEALTNVVKHARTDRCRVRLEYAPDTLGIEITDDGIGGGPGVVPTGRPTGHGIIGMRERTALHGGLFEAGPLPLRGYRVAASLPLERADA
jgi:signal transduction histidine kinase